jgi:hypothetical protein
LIGENAMANGTDLESFGNNNVVLTSDSPAVATYESVDWIAWKGWTSDDYGIYFAQITFHENGNLSTLTVTAQVPNVGTSAGPALAVFKNSQIFMAWKGQASDERIWVTDAALAGSVESGLSWGTQRLGPSPAGTDAGPALAATEDALFIAWKGRGDAGDSAQIWWSQSPDGVNWSPQSPIAQVGGTTDTPALAAVGNTLFLAWKAEKGDNRIFWSKCTDGKNWSPQLPVPGVGGTTCGPALAALSDGSLRLVWKGEGDGRIGPIGDSRIFFTSLESPLTNIDWKTPQQMVDGANSYCRLAIASTSGCLAWVGPIVANGLWGAIYAGLLATLTAPPPPPPLTQQLFYKNGKVYGLGFQSNLPCSVTITEGAGLDPAGPWNGDINYPGIPIESPCDGNPGQYFVVQATNSIGQSATLQINC